MTTGQLSNRFLQDLRDQVEAVRLEARGLTHDLTAAQMKWQPGPGRWSIAQCLDHVARTVRLYPVKFRELAAVAREREQRGEKPYREGMMARWLIRTLEPPYRMRVRTMASMEPPQELDAEQVVNDFDVAHAELEAMITSADGVPLNHARMTSPFSKLMRMTLGQVLEVNAVHARRHLWQARQVRQEPGFPA